MYDIIESIRWNIVPTSSTQTDQFTLQKGSEMNMVFELNRLTCHPLPTPSVDILIHTLPYPIKRIYFGA